MEPAFCPNPQCEHHQPESKVAACRSRFWIHVGFYTTSVSGRVGRFRCTSCGRGFSERTFSLDYFTKKALDNREIFRSISAGESVAAIARHLCCSEASVQNRLERLGRGSLALHADLCASLKLSEDLAADGFESFDVSQFFPNNISLLIGVKSQFLYGAIHTTIRRKGRMTDRQRTLRTALEKEYRAPPAGIASSFARLVARIPDLWDPERHPVLRLRTDEHKAYPGAIDSLATLREARALGRFRHERYSSRAPRTVANPLFPINYYDRELRKDIAAFRRESTCFTRNVGNGLLRLASHLAWHNYGKNFRIGIRGFEGITHAVQAGIGEERIRERVERLFSDRPFLSRQRLTDDWIDIWLKRNKTPLKKSAEYIPQYARIC